jgi:hypothetical protein
VVHFAAAIDATTARGRCCQAVVTARHVWRSHQRQAVLHRPSADEMQDGFPVGAIVTAAMGLAINRNDIRSYRLHRLNPLQKALLKLLRVDAGKHASKRIVGMISNRVCALVRSIRGSSTVAKEAAKASSRTGACEISKHHADSYGRIMLHSVPERSEDAIAYGSKERNGRRDPDDL